MEEKLYKIKKGSVMNFYSTEPSIVINGIEGAELTQKVRDDKNKFTSSFSQNGTTRILSGKISAEENTQYTFSAISTLGHTLQFAVSYFNAENNLISSSAYFGNGRSFTTPANTSSINIQVRDFENSGVNNNINVSEVIDAQLELGTTKTAYQEPGASPSIEYPSEIENAINSIDITINGKNFLGYKENSTVTSQGVTVDYNNGIFTVNGKVTDERDLYLNLVDVLTINSYANQGNQPLRKLYKNKYILSYKFISGTKSTTNMNFLLLNKMANSTSSFSMNQCHYTNKSMIVDVTENLSYFAYFWLPKNMTFSNFKFEIQLEIGETVTKSEPYKEVETIIDLPENIFIGTINNYKDILKNINGKWILKKYIKKIEFNGTEQWEKDSSGIYHILKSKIPGMSSLSYNNKNMICNCFLISQTTSTPIGTFRIGSSYLNFNYDDGVGGLDNWKAKLIELYNAGTPLTVYYLADEEEIELSNLSNFSNMRCIIGENNFSSYPNKSIIFYYDERKEEDTILPITITNIGKLLPFNLTIDYNKTNLPLMAEAIEASQTITGADGDIVLDTTYGSRLFEIDAVTDDFLTSEQKETKREEIRKFLNSIKKVNTKLIIEPLNRTFEVKYSGLAEDTNLPKCVEFIIPLKSASAYAISNETYSQIGEGEIESETEEPTGFICTINGPSNYPRITLNGYLMDYDNVILDGEKLIIDTKKSTVTHINKMGIETNGMAYYNHQFPKIQKGVNVLNIVDGVENEKLQIEWNDLLL